MIDALRLQPLFDPLCAQTICLRPKRKLCVGELAQGQPNISKLTLFTPASQREPLCVSGSSALDGSFWGVPFRPSGGRIPADTVEELKLLASVAGGAGGSLRGSTEEMVVQLQRSFAVPTAAHLM